ncbi:UNVERIFIED_CONTAM: Gamma-aminobutyric acid type B receptor subunit 2 [Siphonaria sp. JEL0065]|nr:Gamma-aminobutyric acid type B receptor subunit 2 [Siphonaria sp. JEL0065]
MFLLSTPSLDRKPLLPRLSYGSFHAIGQTEMVEVEQDVVSPKQGDFRCATNTGRTTKGTVSLIEQGVSMAANAISDWFIGLGGALLSAGVDLVVPKEEEWFHKRRRFSLDENLFLEGMWSSSHHNGSSAVECNYSDEGVVLLSHEQDFRTFCNSNGQEDGVETQVIHIPIWTNDFSIKTNNSGEPPLKDDIVQTLIAMNADNFFREHDLSASIVLDDLNKEIETLRSLPSVTRRSRMISVSSNGLDNVDLTSPCLVGQRAIIGVETVGAEERGAAENEQVGEEEPVVFLDGVLGRMDDSLDVDEDLHILKMKATFRIASFSLILCATLIRAQEGMPVAPGKEQTEVTIAVLGIYSALSYNTPDDIAYFDPYNTPGWQLFDDVSINQAALMINANESILPNTTLHIKHFNNYDPRFDYSPYATDSLGYSSLVALDIAQNPEHQNILAVIGGWDSYTGKVEAEIYSYYNIPYCGLIMSDGFLDDKNNYKSFFRTAWSETGFGRHVLKFLQIHNVTRIGIVSDGNMDRSRDILETLLAHNIEVTVFETLYGGLKEAAGIVKILKKNDVRYIYLDFFWGQQTGYVYFTAYQMGMVGADYIWISQSFPGYPDAITDFPPNPYNQTAGFVWIYGICFAFFPSTKSETGAPLINWNWTDFSPAYVTFNNSLAANWPVVDFLNIENIDLGINTTTLPFWQPQAYMEGAYDCVNTLAAGFDKLLREEPSLTPEMLATRQLQERLNIPLWQRSGYQGIGNMPLIYSDQGSMQVAYYWISAMGADDYGNPSGNIFMTSYPDLHVTYDDTALVFSGNGTTWPHDGSIQWEFVDLLDNSSYVAKNEEGTSDIKLALQ